MIRSKLSYLSQIACAGAMVFGLLGAAQAQQSGMDPSKLPVPAIRQGAPGTGTVHVGIEN